MRSIPLEVRFWQKVSKSADPDGCWLWAGATTSTGYGSLTVNNRRQKAHRVAYELRYGPIPEGQEVCHNCPGGDNPLCVNPAHLWLGTHRQNMQDSVVKNRHSNWAKNRLGQPPNGRVTEQDVRDIRAAYDRGVSTYKLSARYGITRTSVANIVRRKSWVHVK